MRKPLTGLLFTIAFLTLSFSSQALAQESLTFNYKYNLQLTEKVDKEPRITGVDAIDYPEAAAKKWVTGVVKAELTLGEDGKSRDITTTQGLPQGVSEAVTKILQNIRFETARFQEKTVPVKLLFEFHISPLYAENDKKVNNAQITSQPEAVYPASYTGERVSGKVEVKVQLLANLTVRVVKATTTLPKEFEDAAKDAAREIKFTPATLKKNDEAVSQPATIVFEFK